MPRSIPRTPGAMVIAEESTAWPGVSQPTYAGSLGFGFKWNMGWMHDSLDYFSKDPIHRQYHHNSLTFGLLYAWTENFILPLSHDEVVHGKGSLIDKMPGDRWQKFANLRSLYAFMWAHPGKKLLFMGCEFGQVSEWKHDQSLDWHLCEYPEHQGLQRLVRDLNTFYRAEPATLGQRRRAGRLPVAGGQRRRRERALLLPLRPPWRGPSRSSAFCNFSPVPRPGFRVGVPGPGRWTEAMNTDAGIYAGSNTGNGGGVKPKKCPGTASPTAPRSRCLPWA